MIKNKKVLVTGAGGFIGSHLVESLVSQCAEIRAFVRYNSRQDWGLLSHLPGEVLANVHVISGDLRDANAVDKSMNGIDVVFHLGALIAIPYSYLHPDEVVSVNVTGTLNVLNAAKKTGVELVIHTSTSEVYGNALYTPMDEKHPLQAQSPYSASKIAADKLAESYWHTYDLPVVTIRPFNTFGPRQSTRAIIPTIITQALTADQVAIGSVQPRRDFTYVSDTVEGFVKAANTSDISGMTINLGTGHEISIGELAHHIIAITGRSIAIATDSTRIRPKGSEVDRLCSDNSLASQVLGWHNNVSLEDGLKRTVEWVQTHLTDFRLIGQYSV